ncbi:MAG: hypothetical protein EBR34_12255 [Sphingomonadaceae bacterium]|nr:hypothetical protein [Sphingomonadaceae bacterium]
MSWPWSDDIADIQIMRHISLVTGKKIIAVSWWTFAYLLLAGGVFALSSMGDCTQNAGSPACTASSNTFTNTVLAAELLTYFALTWLIFFRRR